MSAAKVPVDAMHVRMFEAAQSIFPEWQMESWEGTLWRQSPGGETKACKIIVIRGRKKIFGFFPWYRNILAIEAYDGASGRPIVRAVYIDSGLSPLDTAHLRTDISYHSMELSCKEEIPSTPEIVTISKLPIAEYLL